MVSELPWIIMSEFWLHQLKAGKGVKITGLNSQSIRNKMDILRASFLDGTFDVVAISENWLNSNDHDATIYSQGYNHFRVDRRQIPGEAGRGGGLIIFVRDVHVCDEHVFSRYNLSDAEFQLQCLKIAMGHRKPIILLNTYKPPWGNTTGALDRLDNVLKILVGHSRIELVVIGDLNIDLLKKREVASKRLTDVLRRNNLRQLIRTPTRHSDGARTLIDIIATTICDVGKSGTIVENISDHQAVFMFKEKGHSQQEIKTINVGSLHNIDAYVLENELLSFDWDVIYNIQNPSTAWDILFGRIIASIRSRRLRWRSNTMLT